MTEIEGIEYLNTENVTNMTGMFANCEKLSELDGSGFKTDKVTKMEEMFLACKSLTTLDLSSFNTENVMHIGSMFYGCSNLTTLDLSSFNTANVMYMSYLFGSCPNLQTIYVGDDWTVSENTNCADMFPGCDNLVGGKGTVYNPDKTDKAYARIDYGADGMGYLKKVGIPYAVFADGTLTLFCTDEMPEGAYDIRTSGWESVKNDITKVVFDESFKDYRPESCADWFSWCGQLTEIEGLNNLNTENVTDMRSMFEHCSSLETLDISGFNTSKVQDMYNLFSGCEKLTTIYVGDKWIVNWIAASDMRADFN